MLQGADSDGTADTKEAPNSIDFLSFLFLTGDTCSNDGTGQPAAANCRQADG